MTYVDSGPKIAGTPPAAGGAPSPRRPLPSADGAAPAGNEAARLWAALPRELAIRFKPRVNPLARAILREVQRAVPEYRRPLEGGFGRVITQGVRQSILQCLESVGKPAHAAAPAEAWAAVFRNLGKIEFQEGRSLDCLQTAYRVGGQVAWQHISDFARATGISADALCIGAEATFAYVNEISALSIEGYTAARDRAAGTRVRRRQRLLELLLSDPPPAPGAVAAQAVAAEWVLPAEVAVVALETRPGRAQDPGDLHPDVLTVLDGDRPCLVTGAPQRDLRDLGSLFPGRRAVVGPTVPTADAARSLQWAQRTLRLVQRGVLPDAQLTLCADHLSTLWLLADQFLIRELCAQSLEPFAGLTPKQRARLGETLLVWLQTRGGSAPEIGKRLKVHPQTVRYRMRQLVELFGDRLENPDDRLDLEIALRAEALLDS
ncbi:helix-turn-helix domain-containing protein [Amycolatopsis sp. PS_44_ISF1]|uniref:PucR family transcriptional regulator n=1 Tax=Amycolatopsis sp. PS_44_ISF1 TaxID=2974917 RepID=UPI0028DED171|nr:helix-turn-helix domain-containing protein [Amycolatopsis sp. PS_44_ISF1]MDT8912966.1 helix-turn-helix domain-containing protein [Amycolatopsis sp. PS_44_ISF1]